MKLKGYKEISGTIECITGMRIGGSNEEIEIGGTDNPILRNPITSVPYLPGSSLKGKMRSLLELKYCPNTQQTGNPCGCGRRECKVCTVFGPHKNTTHNLGPTRILVRDANLTEQSERILRDAQADKGINFSEIKPENWINRMTGRAGDPRVQERVPAGTVFNVNISLRIFDQDNEDDILAFVKEGLEMIERDYIGGSGSRGYGQVKFHLECDGRPFIE